MTRRAPTNVAASVKARLKERVQKTKEDFTFVLQRYAAERFLYRLGLSPHREKYVLKGAMLYALWGGSIYRPTRDLDFTGYGSSEVDDVVRMFREICAIKTPEDDGLSFDTEELRAGPIRDEAEYGGLRIQFRAWLGKAKIPMQVDVGFGNAIEPGAQDAEYPTLLDAARPTIRAYPHEAVVAEKLHAMVVLGETNSRYKDFYDVYVLAGQFEFARKTLARSIAATFERRKTKIDTATPAALQSTFYAVAKRNEQWRAYRAGKKLPGAPADFDEVGRQIRDFLVPIWEASVAGANQSGIWPPGGPWEAKRR